jgi:sulfur carrier protein ThiS
MPKARPLWKPRLCPDQAFRAATAAIDGWVRLHWPANAVLFSRNPEHRFSPENGPYEVLYLGQDEKTAALEVLGDRLYGTTDQKAVDIPRIEWLVREFSNISLPSRIKVADLFSQAGLEAARVDVTALAYDDLTVPQSWAESVMTHPDGFHGLLYGSRFTKKKCLALFAVHGDGPPIVSGGPRLFAGSATAADLLESFNIRIT